MDFSNIKQWQIPEGKVKSVSVGGVVIWQAKTQAEQLIAPTISLDGNTLTMTATDDRTQEFVIFVDGVETATVEAPKEETYTVSGTWYLNETLQMPTNRINQAVNFKGYLDNGYSLENADCKGMTVGRLTSNSQATEFYKAVDFNGTTSDGVTRAQLVYSEKNGWGNEAYRTITFDGVQTVSKEFYEWFTANAVFAFTIDGTTYYAKEGMTWGEWVESEYNTDNYFVENDRIKIGVTAVYLKSVGFMGPAANIRGNTEYTLRTGGAGN